MQICRLHFYLPSGRFLGDLANRLVDNEQSQMALIIVDFNIEYISYKLQSCTFSLPGNLQI